MSKIFLNNPIYKHHILGIGSLFFGIFLVGLSALIYSDEDKKIVKHPLIGIALIITSELIVSICFVFQEIFIKNYDVHPLQLVGFEGLWGFIIISIILIIFQFISCNNIDISGDICTENDKGELFLEDSIFAFRQMWEKKNILILNILHIISIAIYNVVGINLTKLASSTSRAVVDNVRSVFVFLFFLFFEPVSETKEEFRIIQFIGLLFLVFGTLVYNEIVVIHFFGLDYNTRQNIVKRKKQELIKSLEEEDEEKKLYVSVRSKNSFSSVDE